MLLALAATNKVCMCPHRLDLEGVPVSGCTGVLLAPLLLQAVQQVGSRPPAPAHATTHITPLKQHRAAALDDTAGLAPYTPIINLSRHNINQQHIGKSPQVKMATTTASKEYTSTHGMWASCIMAPALNSRYTAFCCPLLHSLYSLSVASCCMHCL